MEQTAKRHLTGGRAATPGALPAYDSRNMRREGTVEFVRLTGRPAARTALEEVPFVPDKRFQLLTYLAHDGDWVGRERAAFLFWPDSDTATSKQNLRGLLQRLRSLPFDPGIEVSPHQLRWRVPSDIAELREALAAGDSRRALEAVKGPLLLGLDGDDVGEYSEWLAIEREQLHSRWRAVALEVMAATTAANVGEAPALLRRLVEADGLDEEPVRAYMHVMTRLGRPADALRAYRDLAVRLQRELDLEPSSETIQAYERAREAAEALPAAGSEGPAENVSISPSTSREAAPGPTRPPTPSTSFVGREAELGDVTTMLRDPGCRVLSLTGPGGIGKTRLALATAGALEAEFENGVVFVRLESLTDPAEVGPAVANALGLGQSSRPDRMDEVESELKGSEVLLVLDNFEHVLDAARLLPRLLAAGPGVKMVVTTRERVGIEAEWVYPVDGLDYPEGEVTADQLAGFESARLLLERARRVRPGFVFTDSDMPALMKLFELTAGLPLAIELAAVWLRAVPLTTLVEELDRDPGALLIADSDKTQRHSSVRAVFEQSWTRLTTVEQRVMRRLAAFVDAFTAEAATFVADANRGVLGALVDKSLLRLGADGRYTRHPLVKSFTREKLAADTAEQEEVWGRHTAYYLRFLRERTDRAKGPRPGDVLREVSAEWRELKAVMRRAAERFDRADLVHLMNLLELDLGYFQAHGHDDETLKSLGDAATAAEGLGELATARDLRGRVGDTYVVFRGDLGAGLTEYRVASELASRAGDHAREAVFMSLCGVVERLLDATAGQDLLDAALERAKASDDPLARATVLEHRAYVHAVAGESELAREFYLRSLAAIEDPVAMTTVHPSEVAKRRYYVTVNLGDLERQMGDEGAAMASKRRALDLAKAVGNPIWQAIAHLELGQLHAGAKRHDEARDHLREAWSLCKANHVTAHLGRIVAVATEHGYGRPESWDAQAEP